MEYNPNPKYGSPVRIRMPSGEIKDATYQGFLMSKEHFVKIKDGTFDDIFVASKDKPFLSTDNELCHRVRFVYPVEQMK